MILLGIGDFAATSDPGETIKTLGLGSCVAVICTDVRSHLAGMVHVALPDSAYAPDKARRLPGYFADTGIAELFRALRELGCRDRSSGLKVKLAGGAAILDPDGTFNIGMRNGAAVKNILRDMGLDAVAADLGGTISRTVAVEVATGIVKVSSPGRDDWTL